MPCRYMYVAPEPFIKASDVCLVLIPLLKKSTPVGVPSAKLY